MCFWNKLRKKDLQLILDINNEHIAKINNENRKMVLHQTRLNSIIEIQKKHSTVFDISISGDELFVVAGDIDYILHGLDFHLFSVLGDTNIKLSKIFIQMNLNPQTLYIQDFCSMKPDNGYATKLITFVKDYAVYNHFDKIFGYIEPTDYNRDKEKLYHFYEKNGFLISDTDISARKRLTWEYNHLK